MIEGRGGDAAGEPSLTGPHVASLDLVGPFLLLLHPAISVPSPQHSHHNQLLLAFQFLHSFPSLTTVPPKAFFNLKKKNYMMAFPGQRKHHVFGIFHYVIHEIVKCKIIEIT